jgi:ubiquinone/menaquinone biosynthesis C-methylase UbiE
MTDEGSVRFDRAADYYDRTRALAPETMHRLVDDLVPELAGDVLEIGVGTGRFALPLHAAGVSMVGVDLAAPMLSKLIDNAGGTAPFPLTLGDATALPFRSDAFDAAIAVHVLHLIPAWRDALVELVRVIKPGGRFLLDPGGGWDQGEWERMRAAFMTAAGIDRVYTGASSGEEIDEAMEALGATVRHLPERMETRRHLYSRMIDALEAGHFSFTWRADAEAWSRGAAAMRELLAEEGKTPDDIMDFNLSIRWRVYDLP